MAVRIRSGGVSLFLLLFLSGLIWPFKGPARLELVEDDKRHYAPSEAIKVRLVNRGDEPIYFLTEVKQGVPTARGRRLPGPPIYERRRSKFFFRSDRWVYGTQRGARFRGSMLDPGDSVEFSVQLPSPGKFKVYVRYWKGKDIGDPVGFLRLDAPEIEQRYGDEKHWTSSPSFRIRSPEEGNR